MYKPYQTVEELITTSPPGLTSAYRSLNHAIIKLSSEINEPYATKSSICYRISTNSTRFLELQFQKRKNVLRIFLRDKNNQLSYSNKLIKEVVPKTHKWGSGVIIEITPDSLINQKLFNDYMKIIEQSFHSCLR